MAIPFLNNIIIDDAGHIQFKTAAGANAGKIDQDGNNLVLTNAVGDILLGDGSSDVYIGDGTNNVDIIFEQSGSIKGDGSAVTLTLGGANTTLNLENPNFTGNITMSSKLKFTTSNGFILFDYEPSGDTGEYATEVPLIKVDRSGEESTILARISEYRGVALGIDDTTWIRAGDTSSVIRSNVNLAAEQVLMSAEGGFIAYGFPGNDTTWSNRNEFQFRSDSTTASENGLYIGDGGRTQFIDLSRNLKNIGTINSGAITSTGTITATQLDLENMGNYITFYGGGETNHSITSRQLDGGTGDDIRINTYGSFIVNLDSNNNQSSAANSSFYIGRHGGNASAIGSSDQIFTVDGQNGHVTVTGNITLSSNSNVVAARKFVARDGNGVMLTADDAASGLSIADNGNADFTGHVGIANGKYLEFHGQGKLINMDVAAWSNASEHNMLYAGWESNIGDYLSLKVPGNGTTNHGNLIVGDNLLSYGRMDSTDSAQATNSATNPHGDDQGAGFLVTNTGNATFAGTITASGYNDSNWNTAYNNSITSAAFSGTTTKTLTLTQQDGGTVTASFTDSTGSGGDNLGNHTATQALSMSGNSITFNDGSITSDGTTFAFDGAGGKEVLISSARDVRIVIDDNDDDTNNTFEVHKHSFATSNKLLTLDQSGNLVITGEIEGTTLDINGEANISGNLTGLNGSLTTTANYFQLNTPSGYIQIGAMNTSHAHIYTDRPSFYTNKPILISGDTVLTSASGVMLTGNQTIAGNKTFSNDITVNGTTFGLYHGTVEDDYYFDSYNGSKHLAMIVKNSRSDIIRYQSIDNLEYWNGSSWQDMTSQLANVKKLLDGRQDTYWAVPSTYYKFRFTVSPSTVWPLQAKIGQQLGWSGSSYPGSTILVEEDANDGNGFQTLVTANFGGVVGGSQTPLNSNNNGITNWGLMFKADSALHTGKGGSNRTRITVDYYGWTPSNNSHVTIPLQNLFITSNYAGTENTDYTNLLDYDRNITVAGAINLGHASDTTIARSAAGKVTIEGNEIYHEGHKPTLAELGAQASGNYITGSGSLSAQDLTDIGNLSGTNTGDQDLSGYVATSGDQTITGVKNFTGEIHWDLTAGQYAGDPRAVVFGYSGGNYGQLGYNIDFTSTSGTHNRVFNDIPTRIDLHNGIVVYAADAGSAGTSITWTEVLEAQRDAFQYKGNNIYYVGNDSGILNSNVDHDALTNFVANEHIDWTAENAGTIHSSNISFPSDNNTFRTIKVDTTNNGTANATLGASEELKLIGGTAITLSENAGVVTINGTAETYTAHENISAASSVDNSGNTFIQDITLDSNGHVTFITSAGVSIPTHDNLTGYVANEHIDWTAEDSSNIHINNIPDLSGTYLTSIDITADSSPALGADLNMAGFAMYEDAENSYSIDLKDHSSYTWLRNAQGVWTFQHGTGGDNWTKTFALYLPDAGSTANNVLMQLGQRNSNEANGRYKGVRIVKYSGSSVVDGYLQAGDMYAVGGIAIGDASDTTVTRHSAGHLETSLYRIFDDGYHPNADKLTTARTIAGVSFDGTANISLDNANITNGAGYTTNVGDITQVSAGAGLTGGSTSGNATLNLDIDGTNSYIHMNNTVTPVTGDFIPFHDNTDNVVRKATIGTILGLSGTQNKSLSSSGDRYDVIPYVASDGVMEVGRYIDFHTSDGSTSDFAHRISISGSTLSFSAGISGTSASFSSTVDMNSTARFNYTANSKGSQFEAASTSLQTLRCDSDRFRFWLGSERLTITDTGRVGINDSTPDYTLDVSGNVSGISIYASHDIAAYSDKRVKKDIETIEDALQKVNKLRGVTFKRKDEESDKVHMGVIAQEVQEVIPEVVTARESDGHLSVSYSNMVGVLIEAVKELTAEVEELKKCKCENCNCK